MTIPTEADLETARKALTGVQWSPAAAKAIDNVAAAIAAARAEGFSEGRKIAVRIVERQPFRIEDD